MATEYTPDFPSEVIREGKVQVLVPKLEAYGVLPSDYAPSKAPVFYNPVMEFNRDLTVLAFKAYQHMVNHEITICEPFTSQGIRGIRFAAEIDDPSIGIPPGDTFPVESPSGDFIKDCRVFEA